MENFIKATDSLNEGRKKLNAIAKEMNDKDVASMPEIVNARDGEPSLKARLDKEHQEVTAQLAQSVRQSNVSLEKVNHLFAPAIPANVTPKSVYKEDEDTYFVTTRKANGKGYLRFKMEQNKLESNPYNQNGEFFRITEVLECLEAFVIKHATSQKAGDWTVNSTTYPAAGGQNINYHYLSTVAVGDYLQFNVNVPRGVFEIGLLYLATNGSSDNVKLSIDNVDILTNVNLKGGGWQVLNLPIETSGWHTIRITSVNAGFMNVSGVGTIDLEDYKHPLSYDTVVTSVDNSNPYITNAGAIDYAIYDANAEHYAGSYHGGEVREMLKIIIDGGTEDLMIGQHKIGKVVEIEQITRIADQLSAHTVQTFKGDGSRQTSLVLEGVMNVRTLFTAMTTAHTSFDRIVFPNSVAVEDGKNLLLEDSYFVIQKKSETNQKITTIGTPSSYLKDKVMIPYVLSNTYYNKYYRPTIDEEADGVEYTGGQYLTTHIFE